MRCPNQNCFAKKEEIFIILFHELLLILTAWGQKLLIGCWMKDWCRTQADLFDLKEGDVENLERFAEKSAENLIKSIQDKKEITLAKFIYALGIRNVGEETAIDLAKYFGNIKK